MKIITIIGARPQFIKTAPVSRAIAEHNKSVSDPSQSITERLIHTGQHYDHKMSQLFFDEMQIPQPHINLNVGSGTHGQQTGEMLIGIEKFLLSESPDLVMVYGDTNSTIAGALASVKMQIPVAHVEAGLRSFNREMPEEHNRVLTDHCADLLFCPSQTAVDNLKKEGIQRNVHLVGDTMYDAVLQFSELAETRSSVLKDLNLQPKQYYLTTIHRPYNTDNPNALKEIFAAFAELDKPVVFPVHPRTRQKIPASDHIPNLQLIPPVGYLDMLMLEKNASMLLTDSGGIQKEAYFLGVPCITLRPETEWIETVEAGWNVLASVDRHEILKTVSSFQTMATRPSLYGDGNTAPKIVQRLLNS